MGIENLERVWPEWNAGKLLGEGSFGQVYKITREDQDLGLSSTAAVKVITIPRNESEISSLRSEGIDEEASKTYLQGIVDDFVNEIMLMDSLKATPNIVSIEDYKVLQKTDRIGWDIFIRMEYLTPLNEYARDKTLSQDEVIKIGEDILSALEICAQRNIIHRDIKPENIFISEFGIFKLGDFGIARKLERSASSMTSIGSPSYAAPEVAAGKHYDATVDIYSLGLVLYKLMNNNRIPFLDPYKQLITYQEREDAIKMRNNEEKIKPPVNAGAQMAQVILKACAFEPSLRFQTPEEFKAALKDVKEGSYIPGPVDLSKITSAPKAPETKNAERRHMEVIPPSQINPNKSPKKVFSKAQIAVLTVAVLLIMAAGGFGIYWQAVIRPVKMVISLLDAKDYNAAIEKYEEGMDGTPTDELVKMLSKRIKEIKAGFIDKSIDYSAALLELNAIKRFNIDQINDEILDSETYIAEINESRGAFASAESMFKAGDYKGAMVQYAMVIQIDPDFEAAKAGHAGAVLKIREDALAGAAEAAANKDYAKADVILENGLSVLENDQKLTEQRNLYKSEAESYQAGLLADSKAEALRKAADKAAAEEYDEAVSILTVAARQLPDDIDIKNKINEYNGKKTAAIKRDALAKAESEAAAGDYEQAINTVNEAIKKAPDDPELLGKAEEYKIAFVTSIIALADELLGQGNYDRAENELNKALNVVPNNADILAKLSELEKEKPISLVNVTLVNSYNWSITKEPLEDPLGHKFETIYPTFRVKYGSYAEYYSDNQYKKLTGKIAPDKSFRDGSVSEIHIYADDKLVYTSPEVTRKSEAIDFEADISGAKFIKIVYKDIRYSDSAVINLIDLLLYK